MLDFTLQWQRSKPNVLSLRDSFHCQPPPFFPLSGPCCSFYSQCVKFVVQEEHNVVLFQPSAKDPPQKPMTALHKAAKRPSLLPLTSKHLLNSFLSRAVVRSLLIPVPTQPLLDVPRSRPAAGRRARIGHPWNTEARLLRAAASAAAAPLPSSGSRDSSIVV